MMEYPRIYTRDVEFTYEVKQNIRSSMPQILEAKRRTNVFQYLIVEFENDGTISRIITAFSFIAVITVANGVYFQGSPEIVAFAKQVLAEMEARHAAPAEAHVRSGQQILYN
jgi:hypothetical protein